MGELTNQTDLPAAIGNEDALEDVLSTPSSLASATLQTIDSPLLILGAGGKMGPSLAHMAVRALAASGSSQRVIAVARFSQPGLRAQLEDWGIETVAANLLDRDALAALPASRNVIFMAGQKFGATANPAQTWALNTYLPALVAERFATARIVVFSTGNVYPLTPIVLGGSHEQDAPDPVGEYANSCLGRERIFDHFAQTHGLHCAIMRLNYAIDLRYGVLLDVAQKVKAGQAVDLTMGAANVIWQGDANAWALSLLAHCQSPPFVINVTGPETVSIRRLALRFGEIFGVEPIFAGSEASTALLSNAGRAQALFGYPRVTLEQMIEWTAAWVARAGPTLQKPTHFATRDGKF